MPRRPRLPLPGHFRHVMARGNGRMKIFLDARDCQMFLVLLGEVVESCEIECWAYSLMPNHYHIAVRPTLPNLSEAFQYLNGEYAKWWNARHSRVGHAFQGRFKDQVV